MFFKVLTMKELANTSKILHFSMEFKLLLGGNLGLAIRRVSFFDISTHKIRKGPFCHLNQ